MNKIITIFIVILLAIIIFIPACAADPNRQVKAGDTVVVQYTGKLKDGTIFDSTSGIPPLELKLGTNRAIPGFEKAIIGMKVGDKKTVTVPAADAYGEYQLKLVKEMLKTQFPADFVIEMGAQFSVRKADGTMMPAMIIGIDVASVTVDANHPLAGKDLTYDIELLNIK